MRFLRHGGIYLVRCGFKPNQNQTLGWDRTASRWSAPSPGKRTCREDHAPSHRPQMSSDRLFLDRVARQHCPSPLHRHAQTTTPPRPARRKPDISTLQRIGHFYFALTFGRRRLAMAQPGVIKSGPCPAPRPRVPFFTSLRHSPINSRPDSCRKEPFRFWPIPLKIGSRWNAARYRRFSETSEPSRACKAQSALQ